MIMDNRISTLPDDFHEREGRGPQPIGEVLAELLTQYQVRYPEIHVTVVETAVAV
jgi:hypothetical protein